MQKDQSLTNGDISLSYIMCTLLHIEDFGLWAYYYVFYMAFIVVE